MENGNKFILSYGFFIPFLAAYGFVGAGLAFALSIDAMRLFGSAPALAFLAAAMSIRTAGFVFEIISRSRLAICSAGLVIALGGFGANALFHYEGTLEFRGWSISGEYSSLKKGRFGSPPHGETAVLSIQGDRLGKGAPLGVNLKTPDGSTALLSPGETARQFGGRTWTLEGVYPAAVIEVRDLTRYNAAEEFIKLKTGPSPVWSYYIHPEYPYKIYVKLSDDRERPFRIRALRGKVLLAEKDVKVGDSVVIEKVLTVSIVGDSKWVLLKAENYPGNLAVAAGIGMMLAYFALWIFNEPRKE